MRYEIDENNYITDVYFNCSSGSCTEYTGAIPDGYTSLEDWVSNANIQAYKIVDGNLVYDSVRDAELQAQWEQELQRGMNVSQFINDAGYQTESDVNRIVEEAIASAIAKSY